MTTAGIRAAVPIALVLVVATARADEPVLGRLFTTPAERSMLDAARNAPTPPAGTVPAQAGGATAAPARPAEPLNQDRITLNGIARRNGGRGTAWVNGMNTETGDLAGRHIAVDVNAGSGSVSVARGADQPGVVLRPGQSFEPAQDRVVDVRTPAPAAQP
ncbi:MAG: hypothetical protein AB7Q97_18080 [Gammaproteobacteria bacterium]